MQAYEAASARVSQGRGSPRVLRRSAATSLLVEVLRRSSGSKQLACRGYEGEVVAELIGDPPSNGGGGVESRAIWPGKMAGELERGRETQWCRRESDGKLAVTSTFTVPTGDLPSTSGLIGEGNKAAP
jgi:hypothetical protein